ncbi:response regulator transcription factor [Streptomyces sp. NPDC093109]|uniref:response regulator transcription factor n=1 Tax=Streptomyces sp. NPDC093109 TaxID=3154977 RepID=UPI00344E4A75
MRILLVEDEQPLAKYVAAGLRKHGFAVDLAPDGRTALDKWECATYDVVVLDRDLPVVHGDTVCRRLAEHGGSRILMLTASGTVQDRVEGLTLGADDYLGKPFAFAELLARVHALSRRSAPARPPVLRAADLVLDPARRTAERGGRLLHLAPKEFGVLEHLMAARGDVISAETLLEKVWDEHADPFTNAVRITIGTLRRKLGDPPLITTVTGSGYRLEP